MFTTSIRILLAVLLLAASVGAASFTLGRGASEATDTYLSQANPATNYTSGTSIYFGGLRTGGAETVLLMTFPNLQDSLYNRTVDSAKITLRFGMAEVFDCTMAFRKVRPAAVWNVAQATWRIRATGTNWADSGAHSTTTDVFSTNYSSFLETQIASNADNTYDISTMLKTMDGLDTTSLGWVLLQIAGTDDVNIPVTSANNSTTASRPKLQVWYHAGIDATGTPPRRRRGDLSVLDKIRIYSFTDKGALQCAL